MARVGVLEAHKFERTITTTVGAAYLLYLPEGYGAEPDRRWPLILFLHGRGESGSNLDRVKRHGLARRLDEGLELPAIVVSPQCPAGGWWTTDVLSALLDEVSEQYAVDADRVYVTGLSMGGYGTWALARRYPDRFAAIAPVCGGGDPARACTIRHVPVWAFHGAKDDVVAFEKSEEMVAAQGSKCRRDRAAQTPAKLGWADKKFPDKPFLAATRTAVSIAPHPHALQSARQSPGAANDRPNRERRFAAVWLTNRWQTAPGLQTVSIRRLSSPRPQSRPDVCYCRKQPAARTFAHKPLSRRPSRRVKRPPSE